VDGADWQGELRALIDLAVAAEGQEAVAAALRGHTERLSEDAGLATVVAVPVLGAVAARTGWVGVLLAPERPPAVLAAGTLGALAELARESAELAIAAIGRSSGVVDVVDVAGREWGGQVQALSMVAEVIEVDPVASFTKMAGHPPRTDRESAEGAVERRRLLTGTGLTPPAWFRGSGFTDADLLDACAAAWTAVRRVHDDAEPVTGRSRTIWV
jgi:hypothetical protein